MDLGTVMENLNRNHYNTAKAAIDDVHLVWRNCFSYNEPGSDVYKAEKEVTGFAEQLLRQVRLSAVRAAAPSSGHVN